MDDKNLPEPKKPPRSRTPKLKPEAIRRIRQEGEYGNGQPQRAWQESNYLSRKKRIYDGWEP